MSCAVNVSGAWKYAKQAYVNVGGSWKPCQNIYVNVSGAWKPLYTYSYATGNWGACSVDCGGGTQTRTVTCQRRDATNSNLDVQTVADSFCAAHGLTKPTTSQSCNTQSCTECKGTGSYGGNCDGSGAQYGIGHRHQQLKLAYVDIYSTRIYWNGSVVVSDDSQFVDTLTLCVGRQYDIYRRFAHCFRPVHQCRPRRLAGRNAFFPVLAMESGRRAGLASTDHRRAAVLEAGALPARLRGRTEKAAMPAGTAKMIAWKN